MKFLLTNDDGFDAPGLETLIRVAEQMGSVVVVAPDQPQSGISHQVTTDAPIRVDQKGESRFRVHGTPADCTRIGLTQMAADVDWVIAGINNGGNLGADVYISGTVAAVREATLLGYKGIALSHYIARDRKVDWTLTAQRVAPVFRMLVEQNQIPYHFWNVNFPHPEDNQSDLDHIFCPVDPNPLSVSYEREGTHLKYSGNYHARPRQEGSDVDVCLNGKIAISNIPTRITPVCAEDHR